MKCDCPIKKKEILFWYIELLSFDELSSHNEKDIIIFIFWHYFWSPSENNRIVKSHRSVTSFSHIFQSHCSGHNDINALLFRQEFGFNDNHPSGQ